MEHQDVERVRQIVLDELGPALEAEGKRIEAKVIAAQHAFEQKIEKGLLHLHGENRTRLQQNYDVSVKAAAGTEFVLQRMDKQDRDIEGLRGLMLQVIAEVKTWAGKREGEAAADAKHDGARKERMNALRWVIGLLAGGGVLKWIESYFKK